MRGLIPPHVGNPHQPIRPMRIANGFPGDWDCKYGPARPHLAPQHAHTQPKITDDRVKAFTTTAPFSDIAIFTNNPLPQNGVICDSRGCGIRKNRPLSRRFSLPPDMARRFQNSVSRKAPLKLATHTMPVWHDAALPVLRILGARINVQHTNAAILPRNMAGLSKTTIAANLGPGKFRQLYFI